MDEIVVSPADAGKRLDVFVAGALGVSRGYVRRLLSAGRIRLGPREAHKGDQLRPGDRLRLLPFRHPDLGPIPSPELEVPLIRAQAGLLAFDKPAGLPTHPLDFDETRTVLNAVLARHPEIEGVGEGGVRSGVVHRLDTHTSGVLLFAKDDPSWERARREFVDRRVVKHYLAVVHGQLRDEREVRIRLEHRGSRMRVSDDGGREALTRLRPLEVREGTTLVEAWPSTGLMHQIRVTLAHLGHPIVGDRLYGSNVELGRHLLHACSIRLLDFEASAPVPELFYSAEIPGHREAQGEASSSWDATRSSRSSRP